MKSIQLTLLTFLCFSGLGAQITINQGNFPRQKSFIDTVVDASFSSLTVPTHGSGQVWDFSGVSVAATNNYTYMDASSSTNFTGAWTYANRDLDFQTLLIGSDEYESLDANGWYMLGRTIQEVTYSISTVSGGPNDSLKFVGGNYLYPGSYDQVRFPLAYQDQWVCNYRQDVDFELTVAAYALNQEPGKNSRYFTQDRKVVGEGTLVIKDKNGNPSNPFNALLIRVVRNVIDSTFLSGAPAPAALMTAFGLTQGATEADSFYVFYAPGFGAPVMSMGIGAGNQIVYLAYRPGAAILGGPTQIENQMEFDSDFLLMPNPVNRGSVVGWKTRNPELNGSIHLYNSAGQLVIQKEFKTDYSGSGNIQLPEAISPGIYFVKMLDESGVLIGNKTLRIQ